MFEKILIANRGEIACRVIRSARSMGVATVAVHSEADARALHVAQADEAICIGPPPVAQSYLNVDAIVEACRATGAQAVHPGYGFLSENAAFSDALETAGIVFIGPGNRAIEVMGDKITSKGVAEAAGVSTIPGSPDVIESAEHAVRVAESIGFPVMIKASAGGGGKGMRIAANVDECGDGFERASSEARSSFGDERVFIEKFITSPRHIEFQVFADGHGNVVHLGERECSLQRRHQKVIEEAPSVFLDADMRAAMGAQAVALARAVDYRSAGTVEFVVDAERNFYFLEMNTRLQVEHPVTEMITGLDLVELMIRVAAGEPLPFGQSDVQRNGWSIEARVYAEDPSRGFLPSTGRLGRYRAPDESESVRVDDGVGEGNEVSVFYDPMIAKVVSHGANREAALATLAGALDEFHIKGVAHNIRFLQTLLTHPRFSTGDFTTHFIDDEFGDGYSAHHDANIEPGAHIAVAAFAYQVEQARAMAISGQMSGAAPRLAEHLVVKIDGQSYPVAVSGVDGGCDVQSENRLYAIRSVWQPGDALLAASVNGESVSFQVERETVRYRISQGGLEVLADVMSPRAAELSRHMLVVEPPDMSRFLLSPMPGLLVSVGVTEGQDVKVGEELAVVEAMKMENSLRAPRDAVVSKLLAAAGDSLAVDQPILEFD